MCSRVRKVNASLTQAAAKVNRSCRRRVSLPKRCKLESPVESRLPNLNTGPRVLVVEDDDATRGLLVQVLDEAGIASITALDGAHALRTSLAHRPDVVVLDLGLPETSGVEFVEQWRSRDPAASDVPVVVVTSSAMGGEIAAQIGAVTFMPKPFEIEALVRAVRGTLEMQRAR